MDTDPPCTVDYIFYRLGKGMPVDSVQLKYAKVMGDSHDPADHTIYGSDHYPLVAEFEIKYKNSSS
jgi:endonuclease/exonuclease/phosphatase (EEP) superfamily protein YafD